MTDVAIDFKSPLSVEEIMEHMGNREWRLNNLYYIKDKHGTRVLFRPNTTQQYILKHLWFFSIIPKARQLGICLDPKTRVLTADLKWVPIGEIKVGTEIVSVDEFPKKKGKGQTRKMRTAVVEGVVRHRREKYRIDFDDGRYVICTPQHPWLSAKKGTDWTWRAIHHKSGAHPNNKLTVGTRIRWITKPWDDKPDYEDGWFGGMLDGEGSMSLSSRPGINVSVSQVAGDVWNRLKAYSKKNDFHFRVETDERKAGESSKFGNKPVHKVVFSRMGEVFKLIGQTRPSRFLKRRWWEGKELPGSRIGGHYATITKITKLEDGEVVDLQTSTGTFIAEGFVSHNTTFFAILYLDAILFDDDKEALIIVHTIQDQRKIFQNKIKYAWNHMHPWLRKKIGEPETNNAYELRFPNGGIISTAMSNRGGTVQYLHISEFGYICAHAPEKAEEIVTGAINTVEAGNFISIESTAAGAEGHFYDYCITAKTLQDLGTRLSKMDFKLFFFPWHEEPNYKLDHPTVVTSELQEYFTRLERKHSIHLTPEQKYWYIKKRATQKDKIFQEYPSVFDECFMAIIEGSYFQKEMSLMYRKNRVKPIIVDPTIPIDTWWDLGMHDLTVVLLTQTVGDEIRFVDMYYSRGQNLAHYYDWLKERKEVEGYRYGYHNFPHDFVVKELGTGVSRQQVMWDLGMRNMRVGKKQDFADGIEAVRNIFHRFVFDEERCDKLHKMLFAYRRDFDKKMGAFRDKPRHDDSSHFADPVRLLGQLWRPLSRISIDGELHEESVEAFFG